MELLAKRERIQRAELGTAIFLGPTRAHLLAIALLGELRSLGYSRDVESRADLTGSNLCAAAVSNPWGLVWLFQEFKDARTGEIPQLLSDHVIGVVLPDARVRGALAAPRSPRTVARRGRSIADAQLPVTAALSLSLGQVRRPQTRGEGPARRPKQRDGRPSLSPGYSPAADRIGRWTATSPGIQTQRPYPSRRLPRFDTVKTQSLGSEKCQHPYEAGHSSAPCRPECMGRTGPVRTTETQLPVRSRTGRPMGWAASRVDPPRPDPSACSHRTEVDQNQTQDTGSDSTRDEDARLIAFAVQQDGRA